MAELLLKVPDVALEQARMMLERARWGARSGSTVRPPN